MGQFGYSSSTVLQKQTGPLFLNGPLCLDGRSVETLLSQGARADVVGAKGVAAVHLAVGKETEKSIRCLKLLLQHGADPNVRWAWRFMVFRCYLAVSLSILNETWTWCGG